MNKALIKYLTMRINQGKMTLEEVKEKYPQFEMEE